MLVSFFIFVLSWDAMYFFLKLRYLSVIWEKILSYLFCRVHSLTLNYLFAYLMYTYALSIYRSQNVLGWSKFFVPDQKFIRMLSQPQTFCDRQKDELHSVKLVLKFLSWHKIFAPSQNILGPVKGQGITVQI